MPKDDNKNRWQVELFFKWIKQHLRIKKFLGTSENAVKTQIWCAVATYVLIAIVKKELQLNASLYTLLQILSVSVFEKIHISLALQPHEHPENPSAFDNQLNLPRWPPQIPPPVAGSNSSTPYSGTRGLYSVEPRLAI